MGTKVKGHRIQDEAIEKRHIKNDVKFNENEDLILNHPTHDNTNDLSLEENQVLTQGGNADLMHYHSGGAGGEAGILTRKQIDKTLMNLMLKVNSVETGLDNAIIDQLDDIRDLDHGYNSPIISNVEITEGVALENSLIEGQTYGYRLSAKIKGSQTNTCNDAYIRIISDYNFPVALLTLELPEDNEGYQLFRKNVNSKEYVVSFNDPLKITSPQEIETEIVPSNFLTEGDYLRIYTKDNKNREVNPQNNLFENSSDVPLDFGEFKVNDNYSGEDSILALKANSLENKIDYMRINFNSNELDIARDFVIEYSFERSPNIYDDAIWHKFTNIYKYDNRYTDFDISNGEIVNNEEYNVDIGFDEVKHITAIRITVLYKAEACYITDVYSENLYATADGVVGYVNKKLTTSFRTIDAPNLEYKLRSEINDWPTMRVNFKNEKGWTYPDTKYDMLSRNQTDDTIVSDRVIRTTFYNRSNENNINESDFFSMQLHVINPTEEITIKNMNVVVTGTSGQKDIINHNYETLTALTFNNGENSITTDEAYIETDAFQLNNFPNGTFDDIDYVTVTFELVGTANFRFKRYSSWPQYYDTWYAPTGTDTTHPGNDGTFSIFQHYYTMCRMFRYYGTKYLTLENTDFEDNHDDFRKTLHENFFNYNIKDFSVTEMEFYIYNNDIDNVIDLADMRFHDKKEIFNTSYMKDFSDYNNQEYLLNNYSGYYNSGIYPTPYDPVISTYLLSEPHIVDNLRMELYSSQSHTPKDFMIQTTRSSNATLGDPIDSDIWENIRNPYFISKILEENEFRGTLDTMNGFVNNNLYNCELDIGFDADEIQGIRFIFFEAFSISSNIYIDNVYLYEETSGDDTYELIDDVSVNSPTTISFTDENLPTLSNYKFTELPKNTTGTRNIRFDGSKKLLEVIDKNEPGIIETKTIPTNGVINFLMNIQKVTPDELVDTIQTFISNDGGLNYTEVLDFDIVNQMPTIGGDIKFKFILNNKAKLNAYSLLYSL